MRTISITAMDCSLFSLANTLPSPISSFSGTTPNWRAAMPRILSRINLPATQADGIKTTEERLLPVPKP